MLGRRDEQRSLFSADTQYLDFVGEGSFYGFLARHGRELFPDEEFAEIYCEGFGRPSVSPGMLAIALLPQAHDKVSGAEATDHAAFDMRWKVALGVEMDEKPFAKSTLQQFRAQFIIHGQARVIFERSLQLAREAGLLKGRRSRLAVDSTQVLGRGVVEDTYNLIAQGIAKLCRALASVEAAQMKVEDWAQERGFSRYFGSSIKASREVDWDDAQAREAFLTELIADGERVLALARQVRSTLDEGSEEALRYALGMCRQAWQAGSSGARETVFTFSGLPVLTEASTARGRCEFSAPCDRKSRCLRLQWRSHFQSGRLFSPWSNDTRLRWVIGG